MTSKRAQSNRPAAKSRILIVDDHAVVRQGLRQLIARESDMEVCGEAETAAEALKAIAAAQPDLAIVDVSLRDDNGLDLLKDIRIRFPKLAVLILSMHDETFYAERFLRAGARGYVMKEVATDQLMAAVRRVLAGEIHLSDHITGRILGKLAANPAQATDASSLDALSDRELSVFRLIGMGLSTREIAKKLHVSHKTVEAHRAHIKLKLNLHSASELLQHAIRWVQQDRPE